MLKEKKMLKTSLIKPQIQNNYTEDLKQILFENIFMLDFYDVDIELRSIRNRMFFKEINIL